MPAAPAPGASAAIETRNPIEVIMLGEAERTSIA
jgi:hypothetical protein